MTVAEEFLGATNPIFEECTGGLAMLTRIIVSSPSSLAGNARAALVPAIYAYWERFFRMTFGEFLRSVSLARLDLASVSTPLARLRIRRDVLQLRTSHRDHLLRIVDRDVRTSGPEFLSASAELANIETLCRTIVSFPDPTDWIETDSNVRYEVLEKNCRNLGLNPERLKELLLESQLELYPELKDLVDKRNDIAHGNVLGPLDSATWNRMQEFVYALMHHVQFFLHECLEGGVHRAASA